MGVLEPKYYNIHVEMLVLMYIYRRNSKRLLDHDFR